MLITINIMYLLILYYIFLLCHYLSSRVCKKSSGTGITTPLKTLTEGLKIALKKLK